MLTEFLSRADQLLSLKKEGYRPTSHEETAPQILQVGSKCQQ
jgi:hypothetical protein